MWAETELAAEELKEATEKSLKLATGQHSKPMVGCGSLLHGQKEVIKLWCLKL